MTDKSEMKILGDTIPLSNDYLPTDTLKFLRDNPRVYACTHGHPDFDKLIEGEQQEIIFKNLLQQQSVKNLIPDIKRHGGLMEPILVRHDTKEVIEGNSRLAVYRTLNENAEDGEWELIPCNIVSRLTDKQQAAFLNQIHVKGKTQWSAYEKANFAYVRKEQGWSVKDIALLFGESEATIRTRVKVIKTMKDNIDSQHSHFSYYDVIVRNEAISMEMDRQDDFRDFLLEKIKNQGSDGEDSDFTALELRKKLPVILTKPKMLRRYINETVDLDEAFQSANISHVEEKVKKARALIEDVSKRDVSRLERNQFNAFKQTVKRLSRAVERIEKMIGEVSGSDG